MSRHSDELQKEAEQLLAIYDDASAQRARLQRIEKELRAEGVYDAKLHHRIDAVCREMDPVNLRCSYHAF